MNCTGRIIPFVTPDPEGIFFPGLNLSSNAGSFTLRGDGGTYSPNLQLGGDFTNTGEISIHHYGTSLLFSGDCTQTGAAATTRMGSGASLKVSRFNLNRGELVVEISARSPNIENGSAFGSGYPEAVASIDIDLQERLVVDFPGDWLPPGATLEIVQHSRALSSGVPVFNLTVRVVSSGGFTDYYTWASGQSFANHISSALADPLSDGNGTGFPNYAELFYGINGLDLAAPFVKVTTAPDVELGDDSTVSFLRPAGIDASYAPCVSWDLVNWELAPMAIQNVAPEPGTSLERVTWIFSFPTEDPSVFFRIQPTLNPENFEKESASRHLRQQVAQGFHDLVESGVGSRHQLSIRSGQGPLLWRDGSGEQRRRRFCLRRNGCGWHDAELHLPGPFPPCHGSRSRGSPDARGEGRDQSDLAGAAGTIRRIGPRNPRR